MKRSLSALALAAALATLGAAGADAAQYKGRTSGGTTIRLTVKGRQVSRIDTTVPASCVETTGSFGTRAGAELFQPPGAFVLGRTGRTRALQPAAMNQGIRATKNYTVTVKPAGAGKVSGRLAVSFSFLRPGIDIYHSYIWICTGTARFTAKAT